jgi:phenylacetate-coenzyme A ligase PaaK-like adenylate-forming protein
MSAADELRAWLLERTIAHAVARSRFHRDRIGRLAGEVEGLDDLHRLPLLTKQHLVAHVDELRTFGEYPDFLMYTSGTSGEPLEVPVYRAEIDAFDELVLPPLRERFGKPPLTLVVQRVGHGAHVFTPSFPALPCHISYGLDQLVQMLRSTHWLDGERVRVQNLECNVLNMREITAGLLERGIEPRSFELETVMLSGWHIPRWERAFLTETWGALVLDRYGVTEVNGDAKWCPTCVGYHFDFTVIPEYLDPDSGAPLDPRAGPVVGVMVMTGLYPFNQAVPKIRYLVDDLVEVGPSRCGALEPAVRFRSRRADCVRAPEGAACRYRMFSTDVAEALAPFPDVARKPKTGFLKFRLSATAAHEARIEIELTYPPAAFPSRVAELEGAIRTAMAAASADPGTPEIEFRRPGELTRTTKV